MGLVQRLLGLDTTPEPETRDVAIINPSNLSPFVTADRPGAYVRAVPESALGVSTVYSAVYRISASVGSMPIATFNRETRERVRDQPAIVRQPNPFEAAETTYKRLATAMLIRGEAFAYLTAHDRTGRPTVLMPIDNDEVSLTRDPATRRGVYRWRNESLRLDYDIAHMKLIDVPGLLHGIGPIQAMSGNIGGALKADALAAEQFTEGAWVDGVLQAPTKLTKDEAERLRTQWDTAHAGKRGTAVLEGGITYEPVQMTNADAEFLASRQWYAAEIARAYGIPLPLMGVSAGDSGGSLTYRNIEGVRAEYAQFAVQPVTDPIEAALSRLIPSTQEARFRFSALLRADIATRYNVYEKALGAGILTVNEVRDLEGLPAIAGGDERQTTTPAPAEAPAALERDDELSEVPE